jgi:hypothetical protein
MKPYDVVVLYLVCCNICFGSNTGNGSIHVGRYYLADSGYMLQ